jgi:hypothetical protein
MNLPVFGPKSGDGSQNKIAEALVDDEFQYLSEYRWRLDKKGYVYRKIKDKRIYLHHVVLPNLSYGMVRDHINRNKLDNRRQNLRIVTKAVNRINCSASSKNGTGDRGVEHRPENTIKPWRATLQSNGRYLLCRSYHTKEEAIAAASIARAILLPDSFENPLVEQVQQESSKTQTT